MITDKTVLSIEVHRDPHGGGYIAKCAAIPLVGMGNLGIPDEVVTALFTLAPALRGAVVELPIDITPEAIIGGAQ